MSMHHTKSIPNNDPLYEDLNFGVPENDIPFLNFLFGGQFFLPLILYMVSYMQF